MAVLTLDELRDLMTPPASRELTTAELGFALAVFIRSRHVPIREKEELLLLANDALSMEWEREREVAGEADPAATETAPAEASEAEA